MLNESFMEALIAVLAILAWAGILAFVVGVLFLPNQGETERNEKCADSGFCITPGASFPGAAFFPKKIISPKSP